MSNILGKRKYERKAVETIKKLHLRKGHQYILFIQQKRLGITDIAYLNHTLAQHQFNCVIVLTTEEPKIKVVEQEN